MAEYSGPLRHSVDHEQHLVALANASDVEVSGRASGHSVAGVAALTDEHSRNLVDQNRQQRGLGGFGYLGLRHYIYVQRKQFHAGLERRDCDKVG